MIGTQMLEQELMKMVNEQFKTQKEELKKDMSNLINKNDNNRKIWLKILALKIKDTKYKLFRQCS